MALTINKGPSTFLSKDVIDAWREIPTAVAGDDLNRTQTMQAAIKPVGPGMNFVGQALTAQVMVGDNAPLHYAMAEAWEGAVVVIDARAHENTAVFGGVLCQVAMARKVGAVIVDGAVRDLAELREFGLPVYARAVVPTGPHKGFGGTINGPIQCAGVAVSPGDLVIGDEDGVVVIRPNQLDGLLEKSKARIAKEEAFAAKIAAGASSVELLGLPPADKIGS